MKASKLVLLTTSFFISLCFVLGYTSCSKTADDPCKNVRCLNSGACNKGICICPTGYSGTYCETAAPVDLCLGVVCQHGGTCDHGLCTCPVGYEGANCQTLSREKLVGAYTGNEACAIGTDNYTITLNAAADDIKLTLTNLYNLSFTATVTMASSTTFSFSGTDGSTTYSGTGTLTGVQLVITYTITNGSVSNTCTFTGVK